MMPVLFVSHGPPTILLMDTPVRSFLKQLGGQIPLPKSIVCISAHWETHKPTFSSGTQAGIIYDFGGPPQIFEQTYSAPGCPELAHEASELLAAAGIEANKNPERGLDHGAWVPLKLMFPKADIPIVQISVQTEKSTSHHFELGKALQPLRQDGVLIVGSGGAVHNLNDVHDHKINDSPVDYAAAFDQWLSEKLTAGPISDVIAYKKFAPDPEKSHPFPAEHFLPLLVCLGASYQEEKAAMIHRGFMYGSLSMAAFRWGSENPYND